jgi:hypothetical protein
MTDSDPFGQIHKAEFLHSLYAELHRLEPLLEQNPVYRKHKRLRDLIRECETDIIGSIRPDLRSSPQSWSIASVPIGDNAPATVTPSHALNASEAVSSVPQPRPATDSKPHRRGGPREVSQAAQIRHAALSYLQGKGKPAHGTEIYDAIRVKGVQVRGRKPAAVVANALRWAPEWFKKTSDGFALPEWSNGSGIE